MSSKYHINFKGEASLCRATKQCPFGDLSADHYPSAESARLAYENIAKENLLKSAAPRFENYIGEEVSRDALEVSDSGPSVQNFENYVGTGKDTFTEDQEKNYRNWNEDQATEALEKLFLEGFPIGPNLTLPFVLDYFSNSDSHGLKMAAAKSPKNTPENLKILANDTSHPVIQQAVAANPSTPASSLIELSKNQYAQIRENVAGNSNTPGKVLEKLYGDHKMFVGTAAVRNPNISPKTLTWASRKSSLYPYKMAAAMNSKNSPKNLEIIAEEDDRYLLRAVANNPSVNTKTLNKLAESEYEEVVLEAINNPRADFVLLKNLASQKRPNVSPLAIEKLREKYDKELWSDPSDLF